MLDEREVAILLPAVILHLDREKALEIVSDLDSGTTSSMAEAFMLLNTGSLTQEDWRSMAASIFRGVGWSKEIRLATYIAARLGTLAFSFPKWRFPAQSFGGDPSLLERFGMTRLERPTDIVDPRGGKSSPDLYGRGFAYLEGSIYVELRRAYIVASNRMGRTPATIVVRNSSFFFGRDRLEHPAYVCWEPLSVSEVEALTPSDFSPGSLLEPWHKAFPRAFEKDPCEGLFAVCDLLARVARLEREFERWLRRGGPPLRRDYRTSPDGREHLLELIESLSRSGIPLFLGEIKADYPPWHPIAVASPSAEGSHLFLNPPMPGKTVLALLSGKSGDVPLAPPSAGKQIPAT